MICFSVYFLFFTFVDWLTRCVNCEIINFFSFFLSWWDNWTTFNYYRHHTHTYTNTFHHFDTNHNDSSLWLFVSVLNTFFGFRITIWGIGISHFQSLSIENNWILWFGRPNEVENDLKIESCSYVFVEGEK